MIIRAIWLYMTKIQLFSQVIARKSYNTIWHITNQSGDLCDSFDTISATRVNHFKNPYTKPTNEKLKRILTLVVGFPRWVDEEANEQLMAPTMKEELKFTIHQMPSDKAPRPDDFPIELFRGVWDLLKVIEESII
jgi:hypothetical protein